MPLAGMKLSVFYSRPLCDLETGKSDNSEPTPFTEESKLFPFLLKDWKGLATFWLRTVRDHVACLQS